MPGDSKFNVSMKGKLESYCGEQHFSKSDLETVYSMTKMLPAPKEIVLVLICFEHHRQNRYTQEHTGGIVPLLLRNLQRRQFADVVS